MDNNNNDELTVVNIIQRFAHDYRDIKMNQTELKEMLYNLWNELSPVSLRDNTRYIASRINSVGFTEFIIKHNK